MKNIAEMEVGLIKNIAKMEAGLEKNIAEMEAGLMKKYCWNESGIDENNAEKEAVLMKNIAKMESGLMKKYCWNGSGFDEKILLKWKRDVRKYDWEGAEFSIKFIIYTLRRIVWDELARRIVRAELSCTVVSIGLPTKVKCVCVRNLTLCRRWWSLALSGESYGGIVAGDCLVD